MPEPTDTPNTSRDRTLRRVVLVVSALTGLSAAAGCGSAVLREPHVWGLFGFEIVTLVAAALGVALGLGRPRESPGLASACLAATIFAAATLGRFSAIATRSAGTVSEGQAVGRLLRDPMFEGRVLAAGVLLAVAACFALGSDRGAWKRLAIGICLGVPVAAALAWLIGPGKEWLLAAPESGGLALRIVVAVGGGLAMVAMLAASVHLVVGAFASRMAPLAGSRVANAAKKTS